MSDFDQSLAQIVNASHLPMSVVIIGIGASGKQFEHLEQLNDDAPHLYSKLAKQYAQRDILNFCQLQHHRSGKDIGITAL